MVALVVGRARAPAFANRGGTLASALARWLVVVALVSAGCAPVNFVDAPYAPRKITVAYSIQEDVTLIRWHLAAEKPTGDLRFELLGKDRAWQAVDFSASVFPGGVQPCADGDGVCAQLVLAGRYEPPTAPTILRALHPDYGVSPGDRPAARQEKKTLTLQAQFERGNRMLATQIQDLIGGDAVYAFPRALERSVWERPTVCVTGFHPAEAAFVGTEGTPAQRWPTPSPLSEAGQYCAAVRALTTAGAPGVDEPIAVDTLPEVLTGDHTYTAPSEITPFSYKIVLDLSIPVFDRCRDAMTAVETTVRNVLGRYTPMRQLPTIDLSEQTDGQTPAMPCHQYLLRRIDGAAVAQEVKTAAASWPEQHQRFYLLYFNNLRALIAPELGASIDEFSAALASSPPPTDFVSEIWGFAPQETLVSYPVWGRAFDWLSAFDSSFEGELEDLGKNGLPLVSEIHDASKPIDILDGATVAKVDGGLIRVCQFSVAPAGGEGFYPLEVAGDGSVEPLAAGAREWPVHAPRSPAYLLTLPAVVTVPQQTFTPHQAHLRYEVCTRYCTHAFVADNETVVTAGWKGSRLCMGPEASK